MAETGQSATTEWESVKPSTNLALWCREHGVWVGFVIELMFSTPMTDNRQMKFLITAIGEEKILGRKQRPGCRFGEIVIERGDYPAKLNVRVVSDSVSE